MSQIKTFNGKRETSSGDLYEIYMFLWNLVTIISRSLLKDRSKNKENHRMEWILRLILSGAIPNPEACVKTAAGYRRLYDCNRKIFSITGKLFATTSDFWTLTWGIGCFLADFLMVVWYQNSGPLWNANQCS
jgi:hypothetical protein